MKAKVIGWKQRFKFILLIFVTILNLDLSGCKDEDIAPMVLPKFTSFFPETAIYNIDKRILWIQTHVDGISSSTADLMFKQDCAQATKNIGGIKLNIKTELVLAGKKALVVGYNHFWIVWTIRNPIDYQGVPMNYQVMDYQQFSDWLTHNLGYMPTPDQIRVITLREIQNTPKGQHVQAHTLAEIQQLKIQQTQGNEQNLSWSTN